MKYYSIFKEARNLRELSSLKCICLRKVVCKQLINKIDMSLIAKLFGGGKKGEKNLSPQEAIQNVRGVEEMLQKKSDFLEKKVEAELATAKKHGTKNKRREYLSFIKTY